MPRSLYYANGYVPKLADLRNALRNNDIFHNRYNPHFETADFRKTYAAAIKQSPLEKPRMIDEKHEDQNLLDMLIPVHQKAVDKRLEKIEKEEAYREAIYTK